MKRCIYNNIVLVKIIIYIGLPSEVYNSPKEFPIVPSNPNRNAYLPVINPALDGVHNELV